VVHFAFADLRACHTLAGVPGMSRVVASGSASAIAFGPAHHRVRYQPPWFSICFGRRGRWSGGPIRHRTARRVPVFLARDARDLRTMIEEWPNIRFRGTREQN
jgi:hypothetical protein